jgi:WD40 repeat protein
MTRYQLERNITGPQDSVNALEFSSDGRYLATASEDGVLLVFSTANGKEFKRFVDCSPITALAWHPKFPKTLLSGHRSGDIHTICFQKALVGFYVINFIHD